MTMRGWPTIGHYLLSDVVFLKTFKDSQLSVAVNCGLEDSKERIESMRSSLDAIHYNDYLAKA